MVFSVLNWCAFYPVDSVPEGVSNLIAADLAADVSFLPPISRRRLSKLSKLTLRLAFECAPNYQGHCVFSSQHGELVTTRGLLDSIVTGELMSPAGFSASVHNTAAGLHSIHNHNVWPVTSIAAGLDTLAVSFVEAQSMLQNGAEQVLVVYADDGVPAPMAEFIQGPNFLRGLAVLLGQPTDMDCYELAQFDGKAADKISEPLESLVSFLSRHKHKEVMRMSGEVVDWRWQYHGN